MIPVAQVWRDAYAGGQAQRPLVRVTFTDPATGISTDATPTDGTLTKDASQWPRVTAQIVTQGAITPELTAPPVSAYGGTVVIWQGITTSDGQTVWIQTANLVVTGVAIDRPSGRIAVSCASHEAVVNEDRYDVVTNTAAGTAAAILSTALQRSLGASWPISGSFTADRSFAAGAWKFEGDPWPTIEDIATAVNGEVWFTATGAAILRDRPVKVGVPALTLTVAANGALTGYSSNRRWASNRTAVVYDDGTSRVVGVWQQTDAASPVRVTGPYGRHTRREVVSVPPGQLPSAANANAAATAKARLAVDGFRSVALRAVPAPWLEPGDTVEVGMFGLTERHIVKALTLPLSGLDVMTVDTYDDTYTGGIS